jgi:FtsP/CotA-like multicopper oxidase with cupredoxin domain
MRTWLPLVLALVVVGCNRSSGTGHTDDPIGVPPAICDGFVAAPDLDPAEGVVEVELVASSFGWDPGTGTEVDGLGYNGSVPGPVIEVTRGDTLRVRFRNDMDAPTTIHWHGLRVPQDMDGVDQMQDPVGPGETFVYEFQVQDAGFYWYHPHMETAETLERGLYGTIVARDRAEAAPSCEAPIVLDDVLLGSDDQIEPPAMMDTMGRLGNLLLANGRSDARLTVEAGQTVLLRLVNAANARYFRLALPDHTLEVVGSDGGWLAEPYPVEELVIAPGERYIVRVQATGQPGAEYALENRRYELHAPDAVMSESDPLGDGPTPILVLEYAETTRDAEVWAPPQADVPDLEAGETVLHRWVIAEAGMHQNTIDGETWPDVPLVESTSGLVTTFEVQNTAEMRHPFHLHGQRFRVTSIDGEPVAGAAWKDTVDIPSGSTVTFVSALDNPGTWLYHCHILEHAEEGMAGLLQVE